MASERSRWREDAKGGRGGERETRHLRFMVCREVSNGSWAAMAVAPFGPMPFELRSGRVGDGGWGEGGRKVRG